MPYDPDRELEPTSAATTHCRKDLVIGIIAPLSLFFMGVAMLLIGSRSLPKFPVDVPVVIKPDVPATMAPKSFHVRCGGCGSVLLVEPPLNGSLPLSGALPDISQTESPE